jgi:hypothetical protein
VRRVGSRDVVFYDRLADVALRALRSASTTRATWTKVSEGS